MKVWALAARNLRRNLRRSLATLLALGIGSASLLLFGGYTTDIKYGLLTGYVRSGGHLQIQHRDYFLFGSGNPTAYGIENYNEVIKAIQDDDVLKKWVSVVTPALRFDGVAGNFEAGVSRTVMGLGLVASDVNRLRQWNEYRVRIPSHHFVLEGAPHDTAIVGLGVARVLQLCEPLGVSDCPKPQTFQKAGGTVLPDDVAALALSEAPQEKTKSKAPIELLAGHANGTPNVAALQVLKAEAQSFKELDEVAVLIQLAQAQKLVFGRTQPKATSIIVQLEKTEQIKLVTQRLNTVLAKFQSTQPLVALNFEQLNPFYVQTMQLFDTIFGFIFVLIGSIVLFSVSNTMNTAVVERTVEIGTLRAIGLRQLGIQNLFVAEGLLLGVVGATLGVILGLILANIVNSTGMTWLPPASAEYVPLTLRVWGETRMLLGTSLGLIAITVMSAWWPAYRAARMSVVDALRHV
jgi:putative ABC transport system permease protein